MSRAVLTLAVLTLASAVLTVAGASVPAQAAPSGSSCWQTDPFSGELVYVCEKPGKTEPADPGRKTPVSDAEPSCDLVPPATFCVGAKPCFIKDNVVPFAPPRSAPPKPDAEWVVRMCQTDGTWAGQAIWLDDDLPVEPPLIVQAQQAVGRLPLPELGMRTNPPGVSVTNLETIFTPTGAPEEPLRGTSAFGLVAIATFDTWTVRTGDGDTVTCNPPRSCRHTYQRSSAGQVRSDDDGNPAFAVRSYGTWTIRYEEDGNPVTIPGAQTTIDGPVTTVPVAVAEIQGIVTGG